MAEIPVVQINNLEDLKKILFKQRQITRKAHDELEAIASDNVIEQNPDHAKVKKYMKEEAELLAAYANRPTLTEWAKMGGWTNGEVHEGATTWGATFGVAILTSELILEQVRQMHPQYVAAIRSIFLALLTAEAQATGAAMLGEEVESVVMNFNVTKPDGSPIEDEEIRDKIRRALLDVVQTIIATGLEYGLFQECDAGAHLITETGRRVLFHMQDIQRFITLMSEAHKRFQSEIPVLMTALADQSKAKKRRRRPVSTIKPIKAAKSTV